MRQGVPIEQGGAIFPLDLPDHCPICHRRLKPIFKIAKQGSWHKNTIFEAVLLCPCDDCNGYFIAYFRADGSLIEALPQEIAPPLFAQLQDISPNFCAIYKESYKAEHYGLTQICGAGYRKSFEFLMKDYLIKKNPNDEARIRTVMLGTCIENYVENPKVKEVAKRAAWLGNDETHYERHWEDKDLQDLKRMIDLTIHWIEMEHLTAESLESMPARKAQP